MLAELCDLGRVLLLTRRAGFDQDLMGFSLLPVDIEDFCCSLSGVMIRKTMVVVTIIDTNIKTYKLQAGRDN